jgi:hypothetical protein
VIGEAAIIITIMDGGEADEAFEELSRQAYLLGISMLELAAGVVSQQRRDQGTAVRRHVEAPPRPGAATSRSSR